MAKVKLTRGIAIEGEPHEAGDVVELPGHIAAHFVGIGAAVPVTEAAPVPVDAPKPVARVPVEKIGPVADPGAAPATEPEKEKVD